MISIIIKNNKNSKLTINISKQPNPEDSFIALTVNDEEIGDNILSNKIVNNILNKSKVTIDI